MRSLVPMVASHELLETIMQKHEAKTPTEIRPTPASAKDAGKVRLGGGGMSLRPVRTAPADTADNGKVRLGGASPSIVRSALLLPTPRTMARCG